MLNLDNPTGAPGAAIDLVKQQTEVMKQRLRQKREQNYRENYWKNKTKEKTQTASFNLKNSLESQCNGLQMIKQSPSIRSLFSDEEELNEFLSSLNDKELRIIMNTPNDVRVVLKIKEDVLNDVEKSCKSLEIDG